MSDIVEWLSGVNAVLGAWLIAVPFVIRGAEFATDFAFWNYALVGGGILVLSAYNAWIADADDPGNRWAAVGTGLLGLWLVVVPHLTEIAISGWLLWHDGTVGLLIALISGYVAYQGSEYAYTRREHTA